MISSVNNDLINASWEIFFLNKRKFSLILQFYCFWVFLTSFVQKTWVQTRQNVFTLGRRILLLQVADFCTQDRNIELMLCSTCNYCMKKG